MVHSVSRCVGSRLDDPAKLCLLKYAFDADRLVTSAVERRAVIRSESDKLNLKLP